MSKETTAGFVYVVQFTGLEGTNIIIKSIVVRTTLVYNQDEKQ